MTEIAYVNGAFVPLADAVVHVEDRGFQFADGVYEVIACLGGHFLDMDLHIARLFRSAAAIGISPPLTGEGLARRIHQLYRRNPYSDATVYIQLTRGRGPRAHAPGQPLRPTLVMTVRGLTLPDEAAFRRGVRAVTLNDIRWQRCDIKSIALLPNVLGRLEASRRNADEAIWVDPNGHVLEGCSTNVLAVIDDELVTHPLDRHVLGGITRRLCLELAIANGIPVRERPWHLQEPGLKECLVTSTTQLVMPVTRLDGRKLDAPGPITRRLHHWLLEHLARCRDRGRFG